MIKELEEIGFTYTEKDPFLGLPTFIKSENRFSRIADFQRHEAYFLYVPNLEKFYWFGSFKLVEERVKTVEEIKVIMAYAIARENIITK